jgi:O-antigen/teichoic acid export membrane protein
LAAIVFGLSLASGVTYVVAKGGANVRRMAAILVGLAVVQGAVAWLVLTLLGPTRAIKAFLPIEYLAWAAVVVGLGAAATLVNGYWRSLLYAFQRFSAGATLDLMSRVLAPLALIAGVFALRHNREAATIAAVIAGFAPAVLIALGSPWFVLRRAPHNQGASRFREVWSYSLPCYAGNLLQHLNYRLDVFLVTFFRDTAELGLYMTAVGVAQLLWLPSVAMQTVLFPRLTSLTDDAHRIGNAAQVARVMLALSLGMGAMLALVAPWAVPLLYGERFAPSVLPLWLLLPGITAFCIPQVLCAYISAIGKPQINLWVAAVALVMTVIINLSLVPIIGMIGAAIASTASYTVTSLLTVLIFRRLTGCRLRDTLLLGRSDLRLISTRLAASWRRLVRKVS